MHLKELGFSNWFQQYLQKYNTGDLNIARVITVNRDNYLLRNEDGEVVAEITGKMMFGIESKEDFPIVGGWVLVNYFDNDSYIIIYNILPRKSLLKRKTAEVDMPQQDVN